MLEDAGMHSGYPEIRHITFNEDGTSTVNMYASFMTGKRVSIESNQSMKFMMLFSVLDFFVDTKYPELEGKTFSQKYRSLPTDNDYDLMLRELFRVAKVIRNALVHNPSSFKFNNGFLNISYNFRNTEYRVKIKGDSLSFFYTSLIMYTRGDLGNGCYFIGIMRSIYKNIVSGIDCFSDEFGCSIHSPSSGIEIKPYVREMLIRPECMLKDGNIEFICDRRETPDYQGTDMYLELDGHEILVPMEALDSNLAISKSELLNSWVHCSPFPNVRKAL